jgi:hypothetical protein
MGQALSLPFRLSKTTVTYWSGFFHYLVGAGRNSPYDASSFGPLQPSNEDGPDRQRLKQHARVHLFALASNFYLYHRKHYRKPSYRDDLIDNLRNVAIPGTGVPLSWAATNRAAALAFVLVGYPAASFVAALNLWFRSGGSLLSSALADEYETRLLAPDDWFRYGIGEWNRTMKRARASLRGFVFPSSLTVSLSFSQNIPTSSLQQPCYDE